MAYLQVARCRLIWPLAIKSTSLYIARRSGKSTLRDFLPGSSGTSKPQPLEPGHNPFPSGHILQGRRINRSVPGRPTVPKRHLRVRCEPRGGVNARLRKPSGPSTPTRSSTTPRNPNMQASNLPTTSLQGGNRTLASFRVPGAGPTHGLPIVKGPPESTFRKPQPSLAPQQ